MSVNSEYNLGSLVADTTMKAAVDMIHARGMKVDDLDTEALVVNLRTEAKVALGNILDDGKVLLDSGRAGWLDALVKAECMDAAERVVAGLA